MIHPTFDFRRDLVVQNGSASCVGDKGVLVLASEHDKQVIKSKCNLTFKIECPEVQIEAQKSPTVLAVETDLSRD